MTHQVPDIQSIHPLTPMQQGLLFHTLLTAEPVYVVQTILTLRGEVDASTLQRAWQSVVDRHEILRTLFVWKGQEKPLQVVRHQVVLPWEQLDWLELSDSDQRMRLESFLQADRKRGFDLSRAPLMRMALIRLAENRYELIWTFHHLLLDGWSTFLVIKDAAAIYRALRRGREVQLPHCRPYRDYIAWLQRQDPSKAEVFWRAALEGFTTPTPLSIDDRPTPPSASHSDETASEQQHWQPGLTRALRTFGARHNLTLSTLVHGAWAALLSRYSGEPAVLFGSVVSGRPPDFAGVESMVGLFINTLPVLARVSPETSVVSWLKDLQDHLVTLQPYEHSPLVDVQGWSEVRRDQPLFESILAFENYWVDASVRQRDADFEIANVRGIEQTNYPLAVTVVPGEELVVKVIYSISRFDRATITRLLGHFRTLLEGMVSNPDGRVSDLPLLTEAEHQQLLVEWNDTAAVYPGQDLCLHQLIEEQTARTPDRIAVVFDQHTLTYGELNRRANRLARHLQGLGVRPDVLVGLFVERSLEMLVGILGILKAGGAYVPIDPGYPRERLEYILEDSKASIVLTQESLAGKLPSFAGQSICLDADWAAIAGESGDNVVTDVRPEHLAYVLFTSGSTGRPKGVALEHRSAVTFLQWAKQVFTPHELAAVLFSTSVCFDLSVFEMFVTLGAGGRVILAQNALQLPTLPAKNEVTLINTVPSAIAELLRMRAVPASVKTVNLAGEALSDTLVEQIYATTNVDKVYNLYGPTETTTYSTYTLVRRGCPVTIGRPIANTRSYVLDSRRNPVPIGVLGELYLAGGGLARGYYGRPELTNERFVPNPFSEEGGGRMYRTGDLCRWLPDGNIQYLGRTDHQVKLRGFRIELGEIEATLDRHPAVRQGVVIVRENEIGAKQLVAYVVHEPGTTPQARELRQYVKERLPDFMVPSAVVLLDAFPVTPNGKIDRKALPAPDEQLIASAEQYVAPRDPLEHALTRIWSKILKAKRVGLQDNFFELGGHSLAAIRLVSEVQELTGKTLPLATLFEAPTVEGLAAILRRDGWTPSWSSLVPIQGGGSRNPLFLVHAAHGNVLLYRQVASYLGTDQPVYGLQSEGLSGDGRFNSTVEEMASQYVKEIVTVQPHGPYFLGGYCLGGIIALEIAQQLTALGEKVEVVILLDSYNLSVVSRSRTFLGAPVRWLQDLWFHGANSVAIRGKDREKFLREKVDVAFTRFSIRLRAAGQALQRLGSPKTHHSDPHLAIKRINDQAASRYLPRPYSGRVALIRSKAYFWGFTSPSCGWSDVLEGELTIHELPVYPKGMLIEPYCRLLADAIKRVCKIPQSSGRKPIAA